MRYSIMIVCLAACSSQPTIHTEAFIPGDGNDPVVQQALASGANTAVQLVIRNNSNSNWTEGLLTYTPLFTVGTVASPSLTNYATAGAPGNGNATILATANGLTVNISAFIVPALNRGQSTTVTIPAASDARITYVARVATGTDDFVGFRNVLVGATATLAGYDLNDSGGRVTLGNGTTGSGWSSNTLPISNQNPCTIAPMTTASTVLNKNMSTTQPNFPAWPASENDGGGDFDGDWTSDGSVARVWIPSVAKPKVTGLFWFKPICPLPGAQLTVSVDVDTSPFTEHDSVATLVVYFFDAGGVLVRVVEGWALHRPNLRHEVIAAIAIPEQARRIAIAPMALISANETASPTFDNVRADYVPEAPATVTLASDDFSSFDADKQPTGWSETGGDWLVDPSFNHAVLWNDAWNSGSSSAITTLAKTFPLNGATGTLSAELFAASTYSDATSSVRLDLSFNSGGGATGETLTGSNYNMLRHTNVAIPSGATSVTVTLHATLGTTETSSLYVDDLRLTTP